MSLQRSLSESIVWRGIYFFAVALVNIVASRLLGAEISGWVFYLFTWGAWVVLLLSISAETAFSYFLSKQIITLTQAANLALAWALISGIFQVAAMCLVALFMPKMDVFTPWQIALLGAMYVVGNTVITFYNQLFITQQQHKQPQQFLALANFILIGLMLFLKKADAIIFLYCTFYLIQAFGLTVLFYRKFSLSVSFKNIFSASVIKKIIPYACTVMLGNAVFFLVYRIDYYFVYKYHVPAADIGNYLQASKLTQLLLVVPQIAAAVIFPATAKQTDIDQVKPAIFTIGRLLLQLFLLLGVLLFFVGQPLITLLLGPSFLFTHYYLLWLLPGVYALCVLALFSAYISGKGRVKVNLLAALASLAVAVCVNIVLVPILGSTGAAIASVTSYWVNLLISLVFIAKNYSLPKNWWKPQKADYFWLLNFSKH